MQISDDTNKRLIALLPLALHYALMAAAINSIITIINHISGLSDWHNITMGILFYISSIIVCAISQFYAVVSYRNGQLDNHIAFFSAFKICIIVAIVSYVILSIINYIFIKYIDYDMVERVLQTIERKLEEQNMSPEEIKQALKIAKQNVLPSAQFVSVIKSGIIWGTISGLLVSLSLKKKDDLR